MGLGQVPFSATLPFVLCLCVCVPLLCMHASEVPGVKKNLHVELVSCTTSVRGRFTSIASSWTSPRRCLPLHFSVQLNSVEPVAGLVSQTPILAFGTLIVLLK